MKLTRWQSLGAIFALFLLVAAIMVAGFIWRPVWPGSEPTGDTAPKDTAPPSSSPEQLRQEKQISGQCIYNQKRINVLVEVYDGQFGEYPPLGIIDENHPLVTEGLMENPLTCPSSDDYYSLYTVEGRPRTRCPAGIPEHEIPD